MFFERTLIVDPLKLLQQDDHHALFRQARELARHKPTISISGCLLDSHCSCDPYCRHCLWRARERFSTNFRRRATKEQFVQRGVAARAAGIDRMSAVSGCLGPDLPGYFYEYLSALKQAADIEIYALFTTLSRRSLELLKQIGVDGYYCSIESPDRTIFKKVRSHDDYDARIQSIKEAKELGLKVWSGFVVGLGEEPAHIARGIELLKELEVDAVQLNPLLPSPFTEMEAMNPPSPLLVAKAMAVTRILMPQADLICASDIREWGLVAGCNAGMVGADPNMVTELKNMRRALYSHDC